MKNDTHVLQYEIGSSDVELRTSCRMSQPISWMLLGLPFCMPLCLCPPFSRGGMPLAVLAIEELLGILVENSFDPAQIDLLCIMLPFV